MSELKVIKIELNNHGKPIASIQGTTSYYGISPNDTFYPQAEADKVIADLEQKLAAAQQVLRLNEPKALYSNLETMGRLKHEIDVVARRERHHKYKRCLAMAKWCVNGEYKLKRVKMRDMNNHQFWQFDTGYWKKWHKRWLELAEQFKEAK